MPVCGALPSARAAAPPARPAPRPASTGCRSEGARWQRAASSSTATEVSPISSRICCWSGEAGVGAGGAGRGWCGRIAAAKRGSRAECPRHSPPAARLADQRIAAAERGSTGCPGTGIDLSPKVGCLARGDEGAGAGCCLHHHSPQPGEDAVAAREMPPAMGAAPRGLPPPPPPLARCAPATKRVRAGRLVKPPRYHRHGAPRAQRP